jgi:hypothetical protein
LTVRTHVDFGIYHILHRRNPGWTQAIERNSGTT